MSGSIRLEKPRILAVTVGLLIGSAGGALGGGWQGHEVEKDGVRHVLNPGTPSRGEAVVATSEMWRLGGGEDDILLARVADVIRDGEGYSYILDHQVCTVHVVAPDGEYLRAIGRSGEGPGEFRMPSGLSLTSTGDVCVFQVMPGRVVMLDRNGRAVGDYPLPEGKDGSHPYLNGGTAVNDELVLNLGYFIRKKTSIGLKTSFVRADSEGNIVVTYWEYTQEQDLAKITFDEKADAPPVWAVGLDGRFYINNDWDRYYVEVIGPNGDPLHVIEREYKHRDRNEKDLKRIQYLKDKGDLPPESEDSDTSRDVVLLQPRPNGELWVLSSRGEKDVPEGTVAVFDVFDGSGRFVEQLTIRGPYRFGRDSFHVYGEFAYVVTNSGEYFSDDDAKSGAAGEIEVVCLRLNGS